MPNMSFENAQKHRAQAVKSPCFLWGRYYLTYPPVTGGLKCTILGAAPTTPTYVSSSNTSINYSVGILLLTLGMVFLKPLIALPALEVPASVKTHLKQELNLYLEATNTEIKLHHDLLLVDYRSGFAYGLTEGYLKFSITSSTAGRNLPSGQPLYASASIQNLGVSTTRHYPYRHVESYVNDWRALTTEARLGKVYGIDQAGEAAYTMIGLSSPPVTVDAGFFSASWHRLQDDSNLWGAFISIYENGDRFWIDYSAKPQRWAAPENPSLKQQFLYAYRSAPRVLVLAETNVQQRLEIVRGDNGHAWLVHTITYTQRGSNREQTRTFVYPSSALYQSSLVAFFRSSSVLAIDAAISVDTYWYPGQLTNSDGKEIPMTQDWAYARHDVNEQPERTCPDNPEGSESQYEDEDVIILCYDNNFDFHGHVSLFVRP